MSIIGQSAKFNTTDEWGKVTGEVTGQILDKVQGVKKVLNQLPEGPGKDSTFINHLVVDYYLLKTEEGKILKVEAMQYLGYPERDPSTPPFIGYP